MNDELAGFESKNSDLKRNSNKLPMQTSIRQKHWYKDSWILLALSSALLFSISNMFVGDLGKLGLKSFYYWGTGAFVVSIIYFIKTKEWNKMNVGGILDNN